MRRPPTPDHSDDGPDDDEHLHPYHDVDVDMTRMRAEWWLLDQAENPAGAEERMAQVMTVEDGSPRLLDVTPGSPSGAFV